MIDLTTMDAALKELYDGQVVTNMAYKKRPTLAMIPKMTDFVGEAYPLPLMYSNSQARSATFATGQAITTGPALNKFLLTRVRDYSFGTIDGETMLASNSNKGAFIRGAKLAVDSAVDQISMSLSSALFRNGTGSIGKIAAGGITSGVITLDDPASVVQFSVGQKLEASSTDGGSLEAGTGYVIALNRDAGTVTVSTTATGSADTPSGWTAGDFLLSAGDLNAKISGFDAWLPVTAPSATTFFGVDRSKDTTRLGGVRYVGTAQSIEEALIDASIRVSREGGTPDVAVMNHTSYAALEKALGSRAVYDEFKTGELMFRGIRINGADGPITVFADRDCPGQRCYLLTLDTWELASLGDAPQILNWDQQGTWLRVSTADAAEVRCGYYAQLGCKAPGRNAVLTLGQ